MKILFHPAISQVSRFIDLLIFPNIVHHRLHVFDVMVGEFSQTSRTKMGFPCSQLEIIAPLRSTSIRSPKTRLARGKRRDNSGQRRGRVVAGNCITLGTRLDLVGFTGSNYRIIMRVLLANITFFSN